MDIQSMGIQELEAAIVASEEQTVKAERARQNALHDALEAKRLALPVSATTLDQVMTPNASSDLAAWFKGLPQAAIDFILNHKGNL